MDFPHAQDISRILSNLQTELAKTNHNLANLHTEMEILKARIDSHLEMLDQMASQKSTPHQPNAQEAENANPSTWGYFFYNVLDHLAHQNDPNKVANAADRLTNISQGDHCLPVYIARFERTLQEAQGSEWPDMAKIALLRAGLCDSLKTKVQMQLSLPNTYDAFVKVLGQLSITH